MSKLQQSDLILAGRYVDGELPAHETAAAESRIASDPEFSAAVDRIRVQSAAFKLLPNFKPAEDLSDRTLSASMDQVKAIMGAWPIEQDEDAKTTPTAERSVARSDWKSTVALIASLAGVVMLGMILWQNNNPALDSNFAMNSSPAAADIELSPDVNESLKAATPSGIKSKAGPAARDIVMQPSPVGAAKGGAAIPAPQQSVTLEQAFGGMGGGGFGGGLSGTPMKQRTANSVAQGNDLPIEDFAPVSQVWCVNSAMPDNAVCDILRNNQISVQLDQQNANAMQANSVQAYYVAATPGQMKLALSEISNSADIEMFEFPQSSESPIADAIQQQFRESQNQQQVETEFADNSNVPLQLTLPKSNALAQQLPSKSLPRSMPLADPPPILNSDSLKEGLASRTSKKVDGAQSKSVPNAKSAVALNAQSARQRNTRNAVNEKAVTNPADKNPAQLDEYLDESDQQLRKYLIFILGNEAQNSNR